MKKLSLGWLVWLNEDNMSRRIDMVTQSANSLSILSQDVYHLLVINNGGLKELPLKLPVDAKHIILEENFIDMSAYYAPYLHAIENNNTYFGFLYDDFIVYKDAIRDCIDFLDSNPQISCLRLPEYFTGDKNHNIWLRKIAIKKGLKLNEYGLFDKKTGKKIAGKTEEEIYNELGLKFINPIDRIGEVLK
jgi:hypothetical protein